MNKLKVLILDDNEHVRYQLKDILQPFDCDCFEATNADEALALVETQPFDVLFLDIALPYGISGIEVLREAKKIRPDDLGKVIILTGWLEDAVRREAEDLGAFRWLDKSPLDDEKILEAFRSAIGGEPA
jgi:CheY-like chemotaxis protein